MLLSSSVSSLAGCWSVSLFRSINLLLLLQGHCHLSNRQQTLLVMDAPHRERQKVVVHGQTRHPARLPHGMMAPWDDGYAYYMIVWVACLRTYVDILADLWASMLHLKMTNNTDHLSRIIKNSWKLWSV